MPEIVWISTPANPGRFLAFLDVTMERIDQAFWQVFHAVEAKVSGLEVIDRLPDDGGIDQTVAIELSGPVHAMGVLRREAERRGISCPELIAILSAERRSDLPAWWLALAADRAVGVLEPDKASGAGLG